MSNQPSPKGKITPALDKLFRQIITAAYESGYKDLNYERIKDPKASFAINALFGVSREDVNRVMWDELTKIANRIQREQELKETQSARF